MRKSRIGLTLKEVDQNRQTLVRPKPEAEPSPREDTSVLIYTALFTKLAPNKKRKNKSFSDGTLRVTAGVSCVLMDEVKHWSLHTADNYISQAPENDVPVQAGKDIGRKKLKQTEVVAEDSELVVGAWEVEVSQLRCLQSCSATDAQCSDSALACRSQTVSICSAGLKHQLAPHCLLPCR